MVKKIMLGLIITAVISLTSFGAIYAYQKEKLNLEKISEKEHGINYSIIGNLTGKVSEHTNGYNKWECPENKERIRNNFRYREEEYGDCSQMDAVRNEYQHRYENECNENCGEDCGENEKSFQNQNENSNKQNRGGSS
jgi:hypothetical protein